MTDINPYNENEFRLRFQNTRIGKQLINDYDIVSWEKNFKYVKDTHTPRQLYAGTRSFSAVPFYYLEPLLEQNPIDIYDLGCGWNIFKKYIPNIIGVSPTKNIDGWGDINDVVDDNYIQRHQDFFESVFSINALHFIPLDQIKKMIEDFVSMVKPGGRGFLALNLERMVQQTSTQTLNDIFKTTNINPHEYKNYIHNIVSTINCKFLIKDIDFSRGTISDAMDGNIRLVFERTQR